MSSNKIKEKLKLYTEFDHKANSELVEWVLVSKYVFNKRVIYWNKEPLENKLDKLKYRWNKYI